MLQDKKAAAADEKERRNAALEVEKAGLVCRAHFVLCPLLLQVDILSGSPGPFPIAPLSPTRYTT